MTDLIPTPVQPRLAVRGGGTFPVRRIYCVGRNFADHAREMGATPADAAARGRPMFFTKPADAIVICADPRNPTKVAYPPATKNLHHEMELVVAMKSGGSDIPVDKALEHVFGYGVGLDMTRRDLQNQAKDMGRPWDMGKGFDQGGPVGALRPAALIGHPDRGAIWLKVNGEFRQQGDLAQMTWKVAEVIANLSTFVRLAPGDLIFTGTPAGVSTVARGDVLSGGIDGVGELSIRLV